MGVIECSNLNDERRRPRPVSRMSAPPGPRSYLVSRVRERVRTRDLPYDPERVSRSTEEYRGVLRSAEGRELRPRHRPA